MDKVALKTRLNEIDLAYKASCEALRWLLTETKSAVDNVDGSGASADNSLRSAAERLRALSSATGNGLK